MHCENKYVYTCALFLKNFMKWLGDEAVTIQIQSDSSAAIGMSKRLGAGRRVKHIEIPFFLIQNYVKEGIVKIVKVDGNKNVADLGTKYLTGNKILELLTMMGCSKVPL